MKSTVTVYSFSVWHVGDDRMSHPRKAVASRVAMLPHAEIIKGSAEDINEAELSRDGYWYPEWAVKGIVARLQRRHVRNPE